MAALSYDSFAEEIGGGSRLSVSQFKDGQRAGWSQISYLNGLLLISNELDATQIADLRSLFIKQPELKREQLKQRDTAKSQATVVSDVKVSSPQLMSWGYASHTLYLHQLQNHFLTTGFTSDGETNSASNETFDLFAKNASYRPLFSIPRGKGVCLPYAFIGDQGHGPRDISISYRIKSHPDVMIVFTDASAEELDDPKSAIKSAEDEINDFWSQYEVSRTGKKVRSHWPINSKRMVKLDGRKGVASFVDITRKDDSKDIGYLAVVPGDSQAKVDVPKLRLFVVREANHARARGVV
ncbi:T6SS immunity protein Tli4 family protein [Pseudoduganella sp. HUAS MS19]